jgi:hypothetical protein
MAMAEIFERLYLALSASNVAGLAEAASAGFWARLSARSGISASPVKILLRTLCQSLDKDLILFFDAVDYLRGPALLSFLSQIREGYLERSQNSFPRSLALISARNHWDYQARSGADSESRASIVPFNIIKKTLNLADFTQAEIGTLYAQHTAATGQFFDYQAVQRVWYWSEGQPWLVNALAKVAIEGILDGDYRITITARHIDQAAEALVKSQRGSDIGGGLGANLGANLGGDLDSVIDDVMDVDLIGRLHLLVSEPRVKRVLELTLAASFEIAPQAKTLSSFEAYREDLQYCLDLGLVKYDQATRPANPIYASIIGRYLNSDYRG